MPERTNTQTNRPARRIVCASSGPRNQLAARSTTLQRASLLAVVVLVSNHRFAVVGAYILFPLTPGKVPVATTRSIVAKIRSGTQFPHSLSPSPPCATSLPHDRCLHPLHYCVALTRTLRRFIDPPALNRSFRSGGRPLVPRGRARLQEAMCGAWGTTLRSPPSTKVRTWSAHSASAARTSRS